MDAPHMAAGLLLAAIQHQFLRPMSSHKCSSDNLRRFFDYTQTPRVFRTIHASYGAKYFINDKRPLIQADDD